MAARLDSVLSFSHAPEEANQPTNNDDAAGHDDGGSDDDDAGFEFAFAPPLTASGLYGADGGARLAPADDLFAHGRILPAYPVFERRLRGPKNDDDGLLMTTTAPPSPDTYCAWAPRSAPGSPAREDAAAAVVFPKSASTGEARRFCRLRDLVGRGRSHSDGKEKFVFLHHPGNRNSAAASSPSKTPGNKPKTSMGAAGGNKQEEDNSSNNRASAQQQQKQSKKKKKGAVTEMDMATAHRLFYSKQGAGGALPGAGGERKQQHSSYLPYRTGIVGFFAAAHALGRSHHPY